MPRANWIENDAGPFASGSVPHNFEAYVTASLFDPIRLGAIEAPNRILMAPLTRGRATRDHVPTLLMTEFYSQRATAGLIISESTGISRQGLGMPFAPGLWSEEQSMGGSW